MKQWVLYAFISMLFAGFTSVIAKHGLEDISGDLGLVVRTCFVFCFVLLFGAAVVLLMIWLPDGLLSIPDRLRARRQAREASAARAAAAAEIGRQVRA